MNKFFAASLFVASVACVAGYCKATEVQVTEEKVECAYITAKKARMKPKFGDDRFRLQLPAHYDILSHLDEESDCPVKDTPPTSPRK